MATKISRRQCLKYMGVGAVSAILAACQPSMPAVTNTPMPTETPVPPTQIPSGAGTTVVLWGFPTQITRQLDPKTGDDLFVQRVKDDLNITLEVNLVEQPDLGAKLKAALPAGTGPDIVSTDFDVMAPYWQFMKGIDDIAAAEWGVNWKTDTFTTASITELDLVGKIGGKVGQALYLPGNMQLLGWPYYWIEDFNKLSIDTTTFKKFEDFEALCNQLKNSGFVPVANGNHPAGLVDWYQSLVEVTAPGKFEQAEQGQAKFSDTDMADAFDLIKKVYLEYSQDGAIGTDLDACFNLFHTHGSVMCNTFNGTPFFGFLNVDSADIKNNMNNNYGTFQLPGSKGLTAMDSGIAIIAATKNLPGAWAVAKWITVGKGAEFTASNAGQPMAAKKIVPGLRGTAFDKNLGEPLFNALVNGSNKFRRVLCADVYNTISTVIPGVVNSQITAKQAAQQVQDTFDTKCSSTS